MTDTMNAVRCNDCGEHWISSDGLCPACRARRAQNAEKPDYRVARGIMGWQEGDEPAEDSIRRLRDGDYALSGSEYERVVRECARLRAVLAWYADESNHERVQQFGRDYAVSKPSPIEHDKGWRAREVLKGDG